MTHDALYVAPYISLATFRKDGRKVATPVWAAPLEGDLVMFSDPDAGKVKRLRNSTDTEIAVCDVRGKLLGEWFGAQAWLMDEEEAIRKAAIALREKYGWQSVLLDGASRLSGRLHRRQYIRIRPSAT